MNGKTRLTLIGTSLLLCAGGALIANSSRAKSSETNANCESFDVANGGGDGYQYAASDQKPSFQELEAIIRRDPTARSQKGRLEFGSVKMDHGTAIAQVVFVQSDRVQPFLYKLLPERDSWRVVNVQRLWFVPRSHLLRGLRA
jgi:hypothetical protein